MPRLAYVTYLKKQGDALLSIPPNKDPARHSRQVAVHILFLGALILAMGAFFILIYNYVFLGVSYLALRVIIVGSVLGVMCVIYSLSRRGSYKIAGFSLLTIYFVSAVSIATTWGIQAPAGALLFALFIIFAGISLGARYSLYAFVLVAATQIILFILTENDVVDPDMSWILRPDNLGDVIVFTIVFGNLTLVSWLFNRSMEQSLRRAERSERALRHQKKLLEVKVEERTRQVQAAHLERMQEMHRFAELGHMSVALLHDMANYLTVLSLDIEDLKETRANRSEALQRIQQSIRHLGSLIQRTQRQIKGEDAVARFNIADEIDQVMKLLEYKANAAHVQMVWRRNPVRKELAYRGSINHFWQIILNIISNALDAYEGAKNVHERQVQLTAERTPSGISVEVTDFGIGISRSKQAKIFEPFFSTKKTGTGMGLAIAKRMIDKSFGGHITVTSKPKDGTTFTIIFPKHEKKRRSRS